MHGKSLQSRLTLCNPKDCSLPGSFIHRILQARVPEWVSISFSRGSSQPQDHCRQMFYHLSHQKTDFLPTVFFSSLHFNSYPYVLNSTIKGEPWNPRSDLDPSKTEHYTSTHPRLPCVASGMRRNLQDMWVINQVSFRVSWWFLLMSCNHKNHKDQPKHNTGP